jgi:signal transduction histidine kinase
MIVLGLLIALVLFFHFKRRLQDSRCQRRSEANVPLSPSGAVSWHEEWHRQWADKFQRQAERRRRHLERHLRFIERKARRFGFLLVRAPEMQDEAATTVAAAHRGPLALATPESAVLRRARRRAAAEVAFYTHLTIYLGVMAFLALINLLTTSYPWFLWPAIAWGFGLFSHYMAVFGSRLMRERYFEPAVEREVRREKVVMHTEKQASIDELSATIAHEIRNPIAAAKSLVQQMAEDPTSAENVQYAGVALDELDRVERRISHLLRYAKEEEYIFAPVNVATVVDSALTQMRAKLDAAKVSVQRNYIVGPTLLADGEKLKQVFTNILDNATDALDSIPAGGRRIEVWIDNGTQAGARRSTTVRVRDNGCGIPADKIDRIFNPFFTTKEKGTGLGMAISKKIVEAHEGSINVVSEAGGTTEFIVTLPLPE